MSFFHSGLIGWWWNTWQNADIHYINLGVVVKGIVRKSLLQQLRHVRQDRIDCAVSASKYLSWIDFVCLNANSCKPTSYDLSCKIRPFGFQKAVFYKIKGSLLQRKRWPFGNIASAYSHSVLNGCVGSYVAMGKCEYVCLMQLKAK